MQHFKQPYQKCLKQIILVQGYVQSQLFSTIPTVPVSKIEKQFQKILSLVFN